MKLRTPEQLATLPNRRLMRRHDALQAVYRFTRSENTARRVALRLSVIREAAFIQDRQHAATLQPL